jgi:hypothetical protein
LPKTVQLNYNNMTSLNNQWEIWTLSQLINQDIIELEYNFDTIFLPIFNIIFFNKNGKFLKFRIKFIKREIFKLK